MPLTTRARRAVRGSARASGATRCRSTTVAPAVAHSARSSSVRSGSAAGSTSAPGCATTSNPSGTLHLAEPVGEVGALEAERRPAVTELHGPRERATRPAADPERHVRVDRVRLHDEVLEVVVLAVVLDAAPSHRRPQRAEGVVGALAPAPHRDARAASNSPLQACRPPRRARAARSRCGRGCRSAWPARAGGGSRGRRRRWPAGSARCAAARQPRVASGSQYDRAAHARRRPAGWRRARCR